MPQIWDETHKTDRRVIHIEPVTRLEGHAKIDIFLDEQGNVEETYFQVVELRGFEEFCKGRPAEEMPRIVTRLCGVCPWPHHLASSRALDVLFDAPPPPTAHKIRELGYCAHMLESHLEHVYALGPAPDFVLGPAADPMKRNVLGVIEAVGLETGKSVIKHRSYAVEIENIVGGKSTHPVFSIPGGVSKPLTKEEVQRIQELAAKLLEFSEFTLTVVDDVILSNKEYVDIILNQDLYYHNSYHMGMVDEKGKLTYYGGKMRIMSPEGKIIDHFTETEYLDYVAEHTVPWSYLKFPYLKKVGWKGLTDGAESGLYRVAPLSRMNVADGMSTPKAQKAYDKFYEVLGKEYRTISTGVAGEGVGIVEAPRGSLFHHYKSDEKGLITDLNLIVASAQNYGAMNLDIRNVAKALIKEGQISNGILNMVEMGFRSYDPCFSCATHAAVGQMPMELVIHDNKGEEIRRIRR
jgi:F420-non-reducing hydrogenase large subunit